MAGKRKLKLVQTKDDWRISFDDALVTSIQVDFRVSLVVQDEDEIVNIVVESPFSIDKSDGFTSEIDPSEAKSASEVLGLLHVSVVSICARRDGVLRVMFSDGAGMQVNPSDTYESWQVSSLGHYLLIGGPGRGVSFFRNDEAK